MSELGISIENSLRSIHSQLYPNGRLPSSYSRTSEVPDDRHKIPGKDRQFSLRYYAISYSALHIKGFLPAWRQKGLKLTSPPFSADGEKAATSHVVSVCLCEWNSATSPKITFVKFHIQVFTTDFQHVSIAFKIWHR